jgi:hypothetical protein
MSITPNAQRHRAFLFGRQAALRSTSDLVDQLQAQLEAERNQHAFNVAELEKQISMLLRDLMQARYEVVREELGFRPI